MGVLAATLVVIKKTGILTAKNRDTEMGMVEGSCKDSYKGPLHS